MFGPSSGSAIEIRIKDPAPDQLHLIARQVGTILSRDPVTDRIRSDWQNRGKVIRPEFSPTHPSDA